MLETPAAVELSHDDSDLGWSRSTQAPGKPFTFAARAYSTISDCWTLTKSEVNFLIPLTTLAGFYLGHVNQPDPFLLSFLV